MLHVSYLQLGAVTLIALLDFSVYLRIRVARLLGAPHPCQWRHGRSEFWTRSDDFCVLIPIFGDVGYLHNAPALAPYGERIVVCTSDGETDNFYEKLRAMAQEYGFRVFIAGTTQAGRIGAAKTRTVKGEPLRDEIIRNSSQLVTAGITICIDGDTVPNDDLRVVAGAFEQSGFDVASVRVLPGSQKTLAERLQFVEYSLAMDARNAYPWLTSGAATIAKSDALQRIMASHSLFFSGGDIEVGHLARKMGLRVGHLCVDFLTEVPPTLRGWYRQRGNGWSIGGFRLGVINFDRPGISSPFFIFYQSVVVYLFLPFRWYEVIVHPVILAEVWLVYSLFMLLAARRSFRSWMFLYPIFSLVQVMCAVPHGAIGYLRYVLTTRRIGRIRVRGQGVMGAAAQMEIDLVASVEPGLDGVNA